MVSSSPLDYTREELQGKLLHAAQHGDSIAILALMNRKDPPDINYRHEGGAAALHMAAQEGREAAIDALVGCGADVNLLDGSECTPLHYACARCHATAVSALCSHKADVSKPDSFHRLPLHIVIENHGDDEAAAAACVKALLAAGASPSALTPLGHTPLALAIVHQAAPSADVVGELLDGGADPSEPDQHGLTPIYYSVALGRGGCLELLLAANAALQAGGGTGLTAAHLAAIQGSPEAVAALLARVPDPEALAAPDAHGRTAVHYAAGLGHMRVLGDLLRRSATAAVDAADAEGCTPLMYALAAGKEDCAQSLLNRGAAVKVVDKRGRTPLHAACWAGGIKLVRAVLEHKADVNFADVDGRTALHMAVEGGTALLRLLLDYGADVMATDKQGRTPLHAAAEAGAVETGTLLLKAVERSKADPRGGLLTREGRGLLHLAAQHGRPVFLAMLLDNGFEDHAQNPDLRGQTPLHVAAAHGDPDCVALLCDCAGMDVDARDLTSRTPLMLAAEAGHVASVKVLLDQRASVKATDAKGRTPLHAAAAAGNAQVCIVLCQHGASPHAATEGNLITPLHLAAAGGHTLACLSLVRAGASAETPDSQGRSAVAVAVIAGHRSCAKQMEGEARQHAAMAAEATLEKVVEEDGPGEGSKAEEAAVAGADAAMQEARGAERGAPVQASERSPRAQARANWSVTCTGCSADIRLRDDGSLIADRTGGAATGNDAPLLPGSPPDSGCRPRWPWGGPCSACSAEPGAQVLLPGDQIFGAQEKAPGEFKVYVAAPGRPGAHGGDGRGPRSLRAIGPLQAVGGYRARDAVRAVQAAAAWGGDSEPPNVLVVINPASGPGNAPTTFAKHIRPYLEDKCGFAVRALTTEAPGHATNYIRDLSQTELDATSAILVVGGDGTAAEVLQGAMARPDWRRALSIPVAMAPAGSGCALAASTGILSSLCAVHALAKRHVVPLDAASVFQPAIGRRSYAFLSVVFGSYASIDIGSERLRALGAARFTLYAIAECLSGRRYGARVWWRDGIAEPSVAKQGGESTSPAPECPALAELVAQGASLAGDTECAQPASLMQACGAAAAAGSAWREATGPPYKLFVLANLPWLSLTTRIAPGLRIDGGTMAMVSTREASPIESLRLLAGADSGEDITKHPRVSHRRVCAAAVFPEPRDDGRDWLVVDGELAPYSPALVELHAGLWRAVVAPPEASAGTHGGGKAQV
ncbi:unnamed protein product [Pedinophyceae sp. YPF-701]|nr:unnamed protein product [Pedinophyceae sp. YPF-701]